MDGLALIEQAQEAGLRLSAISGQLVMKGPRRLAPLVSLIAQNKNAVLAALTVTPATQPLPPIPQHSTSVGVTETPSTSEDSGGFADSVMANRRKSNGRQPSWPVQPPAEILADATIRCPRCTSGRVLRELRSMTGGVCWKCWLIEQQAEP